MAQGQPWVAAGPRGCAVHSGRPLELFCGDCGRCVCALCPALGPHRGHDARLLLQAARDKQVSRAVLREGSVPRTSRSEPFVLRLPCAAWARVGFPPSAVGGSEGCRGADGALLLRGGTEDGEGAEARGPSAGRLGRAALHGASPLGAGRGREGRERGDSRVTVNIVQRAKEKGRARGRRRGKIGGEEARCPLRSGVCPARS